MARPIVRVRRSRADAQGRKLIRLGGPIYAAVCWITDPEPHPAASRTCQDNIRVARADRERLNRADFHSIVKRAGGVLNSRRSFFYPLRHAGRGQYAQQCPILEGLEV